MLFEPFQIEHLTLKNKLVMPPMITMHANDDGLPNDFHFVHYGIRSDLGVGMIIVEATSVQPNGRLYASDLGLYNDEQMHAFKRIVSYAKANGTVIAIQLNHGGRKAGTDYDLVAPSAIAFDETRPVPREMTIQDIETFKTEFIRASVRAELAGFDAVEIHAAHGYLLNQFLSPLSNQRTDEYGGSVEHRERLLFELISELKEVLHIPIFVRISAEEYHKDGNHIEYYVSLSKRLEAAGVVLIDVTSGGLVPVDIPLKPGYQVPLSAAIKQVVNIPVCAVGLLTTLKQANEVLEHGQADLIQMGRELLRTPGLARDFAIESNVDLGLDYPYNSDRLKK